MQGKFKAVAVSTDIACTQDQYEVLAAAQDSHTEIIAWKNDRAIAQIAVLSGGEKLTGLTVSAGKFTGMSGDFEGSVVCAFIRETKAFVGNGKQDDGSRSAYPDVIWSDDPVDLEAQRIQPVWINFTVPKNARPGTYTGEIVLAAAGIRAAVPYTLEVLDLTAPDPQDYRFDIELWQYPYRVADYYGVEPFSQEHFDILRPHLEKYRELGGHAITASIVEEPWNGQTYGRYPSMIKWIRRADRTFSFDFSQFDRWVEFCHSIGLGDKIVCYSLIPWGNRIRYYDEKKGKERCIAPRTGTWKYKKVWRQFLQALVDHAEQKGWFDDLYIGIDERAAMKKAYDLIDTVRGKDGKLLKKAAAMNHFNAKYFPLIDRMASVSVGSEPLKSAMADYKQLCARRKDHPELRTTVYTCVGHFPNSFTYSMPGEGYWTILFSAAMGANGYLRWAYDAWVKDPLHDTTHVSFESGDCFLIYPDEADAAHPVPRMSVRLEKLAEGMRDINKLLLLAEHSEPMAQRTEKLLASVRCDYTQNPDKVAVAVADEKTRAQLPEDMDRIRGELTAMARDFLAAK
ncbi:MAG: glycoside hydrolase domain-containing protein [Clostridia bacterium]